MTDAKEGDRLGPIRGQRGSAEAAPMEQIPERREGGMEDLESGRLKRFCYEDRKQAGEVQEEPSQERDFFLRQRAVPSTWRPPPARRPRLTLLLGL